MERPWLLRNQLLVQVLPVWMGFAAVTLWVPEGGWWVLAGCVAGVYQLAILVVLIAPMFKNSRMSETQARKHFPERFTNQR